MPYMYILECADGSYYTGSTWDLDRRLREHQSGEGANHTTKHLPVKLVYYEEYARVEDAFHREKQVQGWSRRKKEALMAGNREKLIEFSRNYTEYGGLAAASTGSASASAISASVSAISASASVDADRSELPLPSTSSGNGNSDPAVHDRPHTEPDAELVEAEGGGQ